MQRVSSRSNMQLLQLLGMCISIHHHLRTPRLSFTQQRHLCVLGVRGAAAECQSVLKLLGITATPEQLRVRP